MGVTGLWSLLNTVKIDTCLSDCKGKKLAVDLSAWIVQCSTTGASGSGAAASDALVKFLCCRGIFFKALKLLSCGISLVCIMDGPVPPSVKKNIKSRENFYKYSLELKELLLAIGIPVIESNGEAEKLCAQLDFNKVVDGVLTVDGDAFMYGAKTVYKGSLTEKENSADKYEMADVTSRLGLTRRDLIAFTLLSKGDYCDGVPKVGEKKFEELMKEFKQNGIEDALDRMLSWKCNTELDTLADKQRSLVDFKITHCSQCQHEGTKQVHRKSGCTACLTDQACVSIPKDVVSQQNSPVGPCEKHSLERETKPFNTELKIRAMALTNDPEFPDRLVVKEFLDHDKLPEDLKTDIVAPDFPKICQILKKSLKYEFEKTMSYLMPAYIKMALHGIVPMSFVEPLGIVKVHTHEAKKCFFVNWGIKEKEFYTNRDFGVSFPLVTRYDISIPTELFTTNFPEMSKEFNAACTKRKADTDEQNQPKMTSFFKVVKRDQNLK